MFIYILSLLLLHGVAGHVQRVVRVKQMTEHHIGYVEEFEVWLATKRRNCYWYQIVQLLELCVVAVRRHHFHV